MSASDRRCEGCGGEMPLYIGHGPQRRFCSNLCRWRVRQRERYASDPEFRRRKNARRTDNQRRAARRMERGGDDAA
jgi:hypothetical protein